MTSEQGAKLLELIETQNKILEEVAKQGREQCRMLNIVGNALTVIADGVMPPTETEASIYEILSGLATQEGQEDILTTLINLEQIADFWEREQAEGDLIPDGIDDPYQIGDDQP